MITSIQTSPGLWQIAMKRLMRDKTAVISGSIVLLFLLVIFASSLGWIAQDWNQEVAVPYAPPSFLVSTQNNIKQETVSQKNIQMIDIRDIDPLFSKYDIWEKRTKTLKKTSAVRLFTLPFGADQWGRNVIKKTIKGAQASVLVGFFSAILAAILGTLFGALAGYYGGFVNMLFEWLYNIFTSIPYILLVLTFAAVLGKGLSTIIIILALTGWTSIYRLIRAEYIKHRSRDYVQAAKAIGASHPRRMFFHILPNVSHVILVQLSVNMVGFIKAEVILSFLGFGVPIDQVSWGTMLAEAQNELIIGKWWQLVAASITMAVLVTAFSLLTDALRDALDPKLK